MIQEGEILRESLVRILTGLKSGPGRLVTSYDGFETVFWSKRVGREISAFAALLQLNKALDVQVRSAEEVQAVISQVRHRDF